jgi:hypothetical protein
MLNEIGAFYNPSLDSKINCFCFCFCFIGTYSCSGNKSLVLFSTSLGHGSESTNVEKCIGSTTEHGRPIASWTTSCKVRLPFIKSFIINGAAILGFSLEQSLTQTFSSARARKKHMVGCCRMVVIF